MTKLIRLLWLVLPLWASAQSPLAPCPSNPGLHWHNCFGAYTYPDGSRYVGEWRDNNRSGLGTLTWTDGSKYVGQFQRGELHGLGTRTWTNGNSYVGEYRNDKRNGRGTFTWADGEKYVGEFKDDNRNGQGIFYGADGTIKQSGEWADGNLIRSLALDRSRFPFDGASQAAASRVVPSAALAEPTSLPACPATGYKHNCFGTATFGNQKYVGEFRNDKPNGRGTRTFADGAIYVGEEKDGMKHGVGTMTWPDGNRYEGEWRDDKRAGQGIQSFPSGERYVGEFRDGKRAGRGTYTFPSGERYVGEFFESVYHGQGAWTHQSGWRYAGEFRDGKRNGQGIEYRPDGTVNRSGQWAHGELTQSFALDRSRFPLPQQAQAIAPAANPGAHSGTNRIPDYPTAVDPGKAERDRLAAEAETARRRQQELEQKLAAESRERERQAAEAEAARRRQQELEQRLAAERAERERIVAQSRERERTPGSPARAERRVALVIGNADYKVSPLDNPVNDATDMDQSLRQLGFQTTLVRNATLGQMREATRRFAEQLQSADVALIYFAGHGIESNRKNYLIPVNAELKFEYELADQAYDASSWLEMLESIRSTNAERVNIVILDACRNNNLIGARSLGRGLGRMDAPTGTFLAYSTAPGKIAADGGRGQRNSPFTRHLLGVMQQANLPIEEAFKEVRRNVSRETNGAQVPWESTSLTGFFTFRLTR